MPNSLTEANNNKCPSLYYTSFKRLLLKGSEKAEYNHKTLQSLDSDVCRYYVLYFLYYRCRGISLLDIVKYFTEDTRKNDFRVKDIIKSKFDISCVNLSQMEASVTMHKALYK